MVRYDRGSNSTKTVRAGDVSPGHASRYPGPLPAVPRALTNRADHDADGTSPTGKSWAEMGNHHRCNPGRASSRLLKATAIWSGRRCPRSGHVVVECDDMRPLPSTCPLSCSWQARKSLLSLLFSDWLPMAWYIVGTSAGLPSTGSRTPRVGGGPAGEQGDLSLPPALTPRLAAFQERVVADAPVDFERRF